MDTNVPLSYPVNMDYIDKIIADVNFHIATDKFRKKENNYGTALGWKIYKRNRQVSI